MLKLCLATAWLTFMTWAIGFYITLESGAALTVMQQLRVGVYAWQSMFEHLPVLFQ